LDDSKSYGNRNGARKKNARRLSSQEGGSRALRRQSRNTASDGWSHVVRALTRYGMESVHSLHSHTMVLTAGPAAGGD
jgi:hypothetical protein